MAEIDIHVIEPAKVTLPLNVQKLAFLNRSFAPQLFHADSTGWTEQELYILDTIMNKRIFMGVRKSMMASPLFDLDSLHLIRMRPYDTTRSMEALTPLQLRKIKEAYPSDAVLSLEYYGFKDSVSVARKYVDYDKTYEAYMGIYTTTIWRIYDLILDTLIDEYILRDTAMWYAYDNNGLYAVKNLPDLADAIRIAAFRVGSIYGERISPGWRQVPRFFYTSGGKGMRKAGKKAASEDWLGAAEIWKRLAYGEKQKTAARACFNMALVCEMEDLMVPALDWATKSYIKRQKPLTKEYIELLQRRTRNRKKLEHQVPSGSGD